MQTEPGICSSNDPLIMALPWKRVYGLRTVGCRDPDAAPQELSADHSTGKSAATLATGEHLWLLLAESQAELDWISVNRK